MSIGCSCFFFFSSRRRHTRWTGDWSSDVCSSDLRNLTLVLSLLAGVALAVLWSAELVDQQIGMSVANNVLGTDARHGAIAGRSEERRVGKECRSQGAPEQQEKEEWEERQR